MSLTLEEALGQVELEPGRTYQAVVNGKTVDVRVRPTPTVPDPPSDDSPGVMLNLWLDVPPSPDRKKVVSRLRSEPLLPDPPDPIPDEYVRNVMIDPPWITDPGPWVRISAKRGELSPPKPVTLDDTDLAPE